MSGLAEFTISGPITQATADRFCKWIDRNETATVLSISIDSPGGLIAPTVAMMNSLLEHGALSKITRCTGRAFSGAALIFACGTRRLMAPDSAALIHRSHINGDRGADRCREFSALMEKFLAVRMQADPVQVRLWMREETCFSPEAAIEFGLATGIDRLTTPTTRVDLSGRRQAALSTVKELHTFRQQAEREAAAHQRKADDNRWWKNFHREWQATAKPTAKPKPAKPPRTTAHSFNLDDSDVGIIDPVTGRITWVSAEQYRERKATARAAKTRRQALPIVGQVYGKDRFYV